MRSSRRALYAGLAFVGSCHLALGLDGIELVDETTPGAGGSGGQGAQAGSGAVGNEGGEAGSGNGGGPTCMPENCPGDDTDCQQRACAEGSCTVESTAAETPCDDSAADGKFCDGMGACTYECLGDPDCPTASNPTFTTCDVANHVCVPAACQNDTFDGDETDVDCGGPTCGPCATNDAACSGGTCACGADTDCVSSFCSGNVCSDCTTHADCDVNQHCDLNAPVTSKNCIADAAPGQPCPTYGNNECVGGHCVNEGPAGNICCNTACTGLCEACVMSKTNAADGTCTLIPQMTDPDNECNQSDANCTGQNCSGSANFCQPRPNNIVCRAAAGQCDMAENCTGTVGLGCPNDLKAMGGACDDLLFCNGPDTCDNGGGNCIVHVGDPCLPLNQTNSDCSESCDENANSCTGNDPNGTNCSDGLACSTGEDCNNVGQCVGATTVCGDGIDCGTLEACDDFNNQSCGSCNATCSGAGTGTCANGVGCATSSDCSSNNCNTITHQCQP
jgi:hypothetical protein